MGEDRPLLQQRKRRGTRKLHWSGLIGFCAAAGLALMSLAFLNRLLRRPPSPPSSDVDHSRAIHPSLNGSSFVTRAGSKLLLEGRAFRFISWNVPNLHHLEDRKDGIRRPDPFEQRDALETIKRTGGRVARIYTLGVTNDPSVPRHILGQHGAPIPGWTPVPNAPHLHLNDALMVDLDSAIAVASVSNIRLIIPFIDNWKWWGGISEFASLSGQASAYRFYSDPKVVSDFFAVVSALVTRVNSITGVPYNQDPTILAWESGNELEMDGERTPGDWTRRLAKLVRGLDANHLFFDGSFSIRGWDDATLEDTLIDGYTSHYYKHNLIPYSKRFKMDLRRLSKCEKPLFVGEFGLTSFREMEALLATVASSNAMGALVWSLRFHARDGGFYFHDEGNGHAAYHFPGINEADREVVSMMLKSAATVNGGKTAVTPPSPPPLVLPISTLQGGIVWRGSTGAESYRIERAEAQGWREVATGVTEGLHGDASWWWVDTSLEDGVMEATYRMRAENIAGLSELGPLAVVRR